MNECEKEWDYKQLKKNHFQLSYNLYIINDNCKYNNNNNHNHHHHHHSEREF